MVRGQNSLFKDYTNLLIKNDALSKENRNLKYLNELQERRLKTFAEKEAKNKEELDKKDELIKQKDYEIARLKALLNMDGTNHNIPTSQTPINKKKVIPNTREKTGKFKGGQIGHPKHKLEKFKDEEVNEYCEHDMEKCPCCNSDAIEKTGEVKEKDELDFEIIVKKRRHVFYEYKCEKCGKIFHQEIPNNLKEDNQYGPQVQAFELTLMNQANVTINKAQKIIYGMTDGEINLSEGYIAKLQKRASKELEDFMQEMKKEIIKQKLLHWDDTVIMVNTNRSCLRFYGTDNLAYYTAHMQKNKEGLDEDEILKLLPKETTVEHDHNKVNYNEEYQFENAECNRHLMSDLQKVVDNLNHSWAKDLKELLSKMNKRRNWLIKKEKTEFEQEDLNKFEDKLSNIILKAYEENKKEDPKRYFVDKEMTLIQRILDYKNSYFLWVYNFDVPFTNNLSERSLRGAKSKMKASGQFENIESAKYYATIRSYIETCNRSNVNIYNALVMLAIGKPYTLEEILNGKAE